MNSAAHENIEYSGLCVGNLEEDELNFKMKQRNTCAQFDRENSHLEQKLICLEWI